MLYFILNERAVHHRLGEGMLESASGGASAAHLRRLMSPDAVGG